MRIKARDISEKDGSGSVRITAETPEDIWHVFNLLQVSDRVTSSTSRKVRAYQGIVKQLWVRPAREKPARGTPLDRRWSRTLSEALAGRSGSG